MSGWFSGLNFFGDAPPRLTPEEQAQEWKKTLRKEIRKVDGDIRKLEFEEKKAIKECKKLNAKGHEQAARHLVKQVVQTRKAVTRMYMSKAQLSSVADNLQLSISMLKMQGVLGKSAHIMTAMNALVKMPEMQETMTDMAREMCKAGIIEEQIEDAMAIMEPDELEDEADAEVNKIMADLTSQALGVGTRAPEGKPTIAQKQPQVADAQTEETAPMAAGVMDESELGAIRAKLDTL